MNRRSVLTISLLFFLVGVLGVVSRINVAEAVITTVYIRSDGRVDPYMAPITSSDNVTYTFTNDLYWQLVVERDDIVIDGSGFKLLGNGTGKGVDLAGTTNVTVGNLEIRGFQHGIWLFNGSQSKVIGNKIANNMFGVWLYASNNTVSGNRIRDNNNTGIVIDILTSNNNVIRNNVTGNSRGIWIINTSGHRIYHNNFVNNTQQAVISVSGSNYWDNDVEGNFWSDYGGVDEVGGGDGVGDSPHALNVYNFDEFPLMGPVTFFDAGIWNGTRYYVHTASNSTISSFEFNDESRLVNFNVTGLNTTTGFCRTAIPRGLLWCGYLPDWIVRVNDTLVLFRVQEYDDYTYLYFTYSHSESKVEIIGTEVIPELLFRDVASLLLTLLMLTVVVAVHARQSRLGEDGRFLRNT